MASEGQFRSFDDLRRSRGGEPARPKAPDPKKAREAERADGAEADEPAGARERIVRRPDGFGPMDDGPEVYRRTDSEEMEILRSFRVRTVFPADVRREVASLPRDPAPGDVAGRSDLRRRTIFTIDGADARDFDDAIEIADLGGGRVELGVHIADVGHYVRPGTALDAEALARATSVYLADQVVPMLPEELSNHLCSLVAGRDRLAYSVRMAFDARGRRESARVEKSVIRSVRRNTYAEVQALLDGASGLPADLAALEPDLRLFERWTVRQQALRDAKGSLRLPSREKKIRFDAKGEPCAVEADARYFAHTLIEETALAANQAVGDLFRERGLPTIYRVHPEKDPEEIRAVARSLEEHGLRVPEKERLTGRDIGRLIQAARKKPNAEALIQRIMGLVERAVYEVHGEGEAARHFGLAREAYLHFTSPIRRYPDLLVHRWLWAIESRGAAAERELAAEELVRDLADVASHASIQAEVAEMAEHAIFDLKVCQYMEPHIGEKLPAAVLRVSPAGLEVTLAGFGVNGFLPARMLGDRVKVEGPTLTARTGKKSLSFSEGHKVAVRLKDVDFVRLQLLFELA